MRHDRHSRKRMSKKSAEYFTGTTLFDEIARTVCSAECLPRKELYESWEVCRAVRRRFRGGRLVDLAAGHGLSCFIGLLLDDRLERAVAVDERTPKSAARLKAAFEERWSRLQGRVEYVEGDLGRFDLTSADLVISAHACGTLSDLVIDRAIAAGARVAVLPCCHPSGRMDTGGLDGWLPRDVAIDVLRVGRLRAAGYGVHTRSIPTQITPKNRLLLGWPGGGD